MRLKCIQSGRSLGACGDLMQGDAIKYLENVCKSSLGCANELYTWYKPKPFKASHRHAYVTKLFT